jgi:DNA-binding PadR family transcriptional regulator
VLAISDGQVSLRTGTLYTALDRLQQQGLVRVYAEEVVEGRMRRTYALTDAGHDTLVAETERLQRTLAEAQRRLAPRTATGSLGRAPVPGPGLGAVTA